jgi:A/G-specific adenine glycosylase
MSKVIDFNTVFYMKKKETKFVQTVMNYYQQNGRDSLPWRKTKDPYKILVSEVMLQQTQVERVISKYKAFLSAFPTIEVLSNASLGEVLVLWQGLGYNRRAKMLHSCAKTLMSEYSGKFPKTRTELRALPGIGEYTSGAVMAFAFSSPEVFVETNIRTVYLHHFFKDKTQVTDAELMPYIESTLDRENPRAWYYALMDYGSHLKKTIGNQNKNSLHYTKQSTFKGSDRQIRGAVIRMLTEKSLSRNKLLTKLGEFEDIRVDAQLHKLLNEQMIERKGNTYILPYN